MTSDRPSPESPDAPRAGDATAEGRSETSGEGTSGEGGDTKPRTASYWPPHTPPDDKESVHVTCAGCAREWQVHSILAGHKFRCSCHEFIAVPPPVGAPRLLLPAGDAAPASRRAIARVPAAQHLTLVGGPTVTTDKPETDLRQAPIELQRRWTSRIILDLFLVIVAFLGPMLFLELYFTGDDRALYMPFADIAVAVLLLLVCLPSAQYAFAPLRSTRFIFYAEALLVAALAVVAAILWMQLVLTTFDEVEDPVSHAVDVLGIPMSIFVFGFVAGILEEIAFRGLIFGRVTHLLGPVQGVLVSGAAFALAHGITLGLPFHAFLGVYLGWLRLRSESLFPCMVVHFTYNSLLVLHVANG